MAQAQLLIAEILKLAVVASGVNILAAWASDRAILSHSKIDAIGE
jgi:hypothetical protein